MSLRVLWAELLTPRLQKAAGSGQSILSAVQSPAQHGAGREGTGGSNPMQARSVRHGMIYGLLLAVAGSAATLGLFGLGGYGRVMGTIGA